MNTEPVMSSVFFFIVLPFIYISYNNTILILLYRWNYSPPITEELEGGGVFFKGIWWVKQWLSTFSPFRACTYIYNVCPSVSAHTSFQKYVLQHPYQSTSYKLVSKNLWKNDRYIWSEWIYPLLLHPLSKRRKALKLTFWQKRILNSSKFLFFCAYSNQEWRCWKEIWKKNFRNIWKIYLKVITFASAFWKEKQFKKEAIFEEFT